MGELLQAQQLGGLVSLYNCFDLGWFLFFSQRFDSFLLRKLMWDEKSFVMMRTKKYFMSINNPLFYDNMISLTSRLVMIQWRCAGKLQYSPTIRNNPIWINYRCSHAKIDILAISIVSIDPSCDTHLKEVDSCPKTKLLLNLPYVLTVYIPYDDLNHIVR
jgi:hypothetical protein